jgi:hypothetical protein
MRVDENVLPGTLRGWFRGARPCPPSVRRAQGALPACPWNGAPLPTATRQAATPTWTPSGRSLVMSMGATAAVLMEATVALLLLLLLALLRLRRQHVPKHP